MSAINNFIGPSNNVMGPSSGLSTKSPAVKMTAEDNFYEVLKNTFAQETGKLKEIRPGVYSPDPASKGSIA